MPVKFMMKTLASVLPGSSDYYAYDLGLIDTDAPKDNIRSKFYISTKARNAGISRHFSKAIRDKD